MIYLAYRNQHYVPQVYLKAWTDNSGQLFLYNKDKTLNKHSETEKVLYSPHLYTRTALDSLILTDDDIDIIFGRLKEYVIKFNGVIIDSIYELAKQYELFDEWEILNSDGTQAKKKKIKHEIDQAKITTTERRWDQIENNWIILKDRIERTVTARKGGLSRTDIEQLYNFMIAQRWRTPQSIHFYSELINPLLNSLKEQFDDETYKEIMNEYSGAYFKKAIMRYQDRDEKSHIVKEIELIKECTVVFYIVENEHHFHTSDNPVFIITDSNFYNGKFNGMYFPLTPSILCAIYKGDSKEYNIQSMPSELICDFNQLIIANSNKYFISKMPV